MRGKPIESNDSLYNGVPYAGTYDEVKDALRRGVERIHAKPEAINAIRTEWLYPYIVPQSFWERAIREYNIATQPL